MIHHRILADRGRSRRQSSRACLDILQQPDHPARSSPSISTPGARLRDLAGRWSLDLANNELAPLPADVPDGLSNLEKLYLGGKRLPATEVTDDLFEDLKA